MNDRELLIRLRVESPEIKAINKQLDLLKEKIKVLNEVEKDNNGLTKIQAQRMKEAKDAARELLIQKNAQLEQERRLTAVNKTAEGSMARLRAETSLMVLKANQMVVTTKAEARERQILIGKIDQNKQKIRDFDRSISGSNTLVGEYSRGIVGSFKKMALAIGAVALGAKALQLIFRAIKGGIGVVMDFEQAVADLSAITNTAGEELQKLSDQAKYLGATTRYTASEVVGLQIELGKLGFAAAEIRVITPDILNFAAATGADLPAAAKTAGVAIRAFGLTAAEMKETVASMAVATTKSALAFGDYDTILSTVGPVAASFGFTLQDTLTLLAKLRDAGFDASKSSTALRNIFLNLADSNGKLAKALGSTPKTLEELIDGLTTLSDRGVDLNETLEMTDKRSVSAFLQLIRSKDAMLEYKASITGVSDEMKVMVEKRLDTMTGSLLILKSAWQGFLLTLEDGDRGMARVAQGGMKILADALTELSNLDLVLTSSSKLTQKQWERAFDVMLAMGHNKDALGLQRIIKDFDKLNYAALTTSDSVVNDFYLAMMRAGFENDDIGHIWSIYLERRKQLFDDEQKAINDASERERKKKEEDERAKARIAAENAQKEKNAEIKRQAEFRQEMADYTNKNIDQALANKDKKTEAWYKDRVYVDGLWILKKDYEEKVKESEKLKKDQDAKADKERDYQIKLQEQRIDKQMELIDTAAAGIQDIVGGAMDGSIESLADAGAAIVDSAFNLLKALVPVWIAQITGISLTMPDAVATFGATAVARVAIMTAMLEGAISVAQAAVKGAAHKKGKAEGGLISPSDGVLLSHPRPDGDDRLIVAKQGEVILNERQQQMLGGANTFRAMGIPGFAFGGRVGSGDNQIKLSGNAPIDMSSLADMISSRINDQNVILNLNELNSSFANYRNIKSRNKI